MTVRIDLHTHSDLSDGTTSPMELMWAAAAAGLDVVALTDHDTAAGWSEAATAADAAGVRLIPGIEISSRRRGHGVHLLAYLPDPEHNGLAAELGDILAGRDDRLPAMLGQLADAGAPLAESAVLRVVGPHGVVGRPHVADALVEAGYAADRQDAFERWLNPGRPGFVNRYAPRTVDLVGLVRDAGGVPVLAHPWARGSRVVLTPADIAELAAAGLAGIEVDHPDHAPADRAVLRHLAGELGLVVTGSSDHHGAGKVGHDLGCNLTAPAELERLLAVAGSARRR